MIYKTLYADNGSERSNCSVIFIEVNETGEITSITNGGKVIGVSSSGLTFVVENIVLEQIDKFEVIGRDLVLKDGEEIIPPVKSEKELQIEAIERQLAALKAEPDEPTDTEEQAETPLLDYTDESAE